MNARFLILALSLSAASAFAGDVARATAKELIPLKNGEMLYVFEDGLMARENAYGRAVYLKAGETLQTADGRTIQATSNEVARLNYLLQKGHNN
jgi:hypothetical protein